MDWSVQRFGIGQPVPRTEDPVLVQGRGRYTDDLALPGQAYAAIVRSPVAHGVLRGIGTTAARTSPGVLGVWTGADLEAAGYGSLKCAVNFPNRDGSPMRKPRRPALAVDKVRWVGDPVAIVVAESPAAAKDAAELVELDIDPLPAVTRAREAASPGAPVLYDEVPDNVVLDYHYGDAQKVAEAFARAAHVTRLELVNNRVVVSAMEPRAAIGSIENGRWVLRVGCQGVFGLRAGMADILGVPPEKVRILTGNVGGSFGMKAAPYPEYVAILHAAKMLGRPVKWTDERSGSFLSDQHGRDHEATAELALDAEGRFLAVRIVNYGNMGAYLGTVAPLMPTLNIVKNTVSVYATPLIEVATKCLLTNTTPVSAYRGAGRPEGNYFMERLIDAAAREMGIDRLELRRRNHIRPEQMPYAAPSGMTYDSGDFPAVFEAAVAAADWDGFPARREASRAKGKLRGRGIGSYLEVTAPPNPEMGGIRFEPDGTVTILTGTLDYGQGHAAPFAQVLSDRLGIPFERIRLLQGDSDQLVAGGGTGGSRSITASGQAIDEASRAVIEKGKQAAAHFLEASVADIEFAHGRFTIAGTDRSIDILELAERLRRAGPLPEGVPASLDVSHVTKPIPSAFPNGCHVAEVEIDPETGVVTIARYESVNDFGTIVNPLLVEGQVHGGIVQGIGQALMERTVYDDEGQLLTGSYMDYALPRAEDVINLSFRSHPVPAKTNALGTKGCGEAGCAGSLSSVMNAVIDALSELGVTHIDMPATPARIWAAIEVARR
ncbi:MAG: xanthine dehydrogenase family protein molybdopterin-binding subunit [Rhodospirillales bacterium]|nr:xanthine dehydrogenase family protein molybdopterin-binding subunit [Rhodospirillales bacterium]